MAYNILIDSECAETAALIALSLGRALGTPVVEYDYAKGAKFTQNQCHIVVGAPRSVADYKKLCESGFTPDHVFYVSRHHGCNWADRLNTYYDGCLETYVHPRMEMLVSRVAESVSYARKR